jgi:pimeloyl-ACP methyl ester carboxylesterase
MAILDASSGAVEVAPGFLITAPGLRGTAVARSPLRWNLEPKLETKALDDALQAAGMSTTMNVEVRIDSRGRHQVQPRARAVQTPGPQVIRTLQGDDALLLEVPDRGETFGQVVLAVDEDGAMSWNFPSDAGGHRETPTTRGASGTKQFYIRKRAPATPSASKGAKRGLVRMVGKKVLKVLEYPVTDRILGPLSEIYAKNWEEHNRPYLVRRFGPKDYTKEKMPQLDDRSWQELSSGKSLLFLHGSFSTAHTAFAGLPEDTLEKLAQRYQRRTFAFNHHTLSANPEENVARFLDRMPDGIQLNVDIVCHSRGGLVARTMAGELRYQPQIQVGRVVFVASPNKGTVLADPDHMSDLIDRYTTMLNLAPPRPKVVAEVLESIIVVVKLIGRAALKGLDGLAAMNPRGSFLPKLSRRLPSTTEYYGITADFEPKGSLADAIGQVVGDQVLDRVFKDAPNDLIVPTDGVHQAGSPMFPLAANRVYRFDAVRGVTHSGFFSEPETSEKVLQWLLA